jgi:hypothetical protein
LDPDHGVFLCALIAQIQPFIADVALVLNWLTSVFFLRSILAWTHRFPYLPSSVAYPPPPPPGAPRPAGSITSPTARDALDGRHQ